MGIVVCSNTIQSHTDIAKSYDNIFDEIYRKVVSSLTLVIYFTALT